MRLGTYIQAIFWHPWHWRFGGGGGRVAGVNSEGGGTLPQPLPAEVGQLSGTCSCAAGDGDPPPPPTRYVYRVTRSRECVQ